jgi:hypothetical protein
MQSLYMAERQLCSLVQHISTVKDPCQGCVWEVSATDKRRQGRRDHATSSDMHASSQSCPAAQKTGSAPAGYAIDSGANCTKLRCKLKAT